MNDDEVIEADIEFFYQQANRAAAQVHIALGLSYYPLAASYFTCADTGPPLFFIKTDTLPAGTVAQADKACIVAVMGITPSRITQSYN